MVLFMLSKWLAVIIVNLISMKSLMIPLKVFHHPSELCEVVRKGSLNGFTVIVHVIKKLQTNLVRLLTALLCFKFIIIHYHTQKTMEK